MRCFFTVKLGKQIDVEIAVNNGLDYDFIDPWPMSKGIERLCVVERGVTRIHCIDSLHDLVECILESRADTDLKVFDTGSKFVESSFLFLEAWVLAGLIQKRRVGGMPSNFL